MTALTNVVWQGVGWLIALSILLLPIAVARWLVTTRWFRGRHRVRWAGERLLWWRDAMSDLPAPLGDDPHARRRR
jgi:hypothetical protein